MSHTELRRTAEVTHAVKLEAHLRRANRGWCGAEIVEEAGEVERLGVPGPLGKVDRLDRNRCPIALSAEDSSPA